MTTVALEVLNSRSKVYDRNIGVGDDFKMIADPERKSQIIARVLPVIMADHPETPLHNRRLHIYVTNNHAGYVEIV